MVATGVLFGWLLIELGRMAVGEFRLPPRLSTRGIGPVAQVPAAVARFVGLRGSRPRDETAERTTAVADVEPWRAAEEVEERVYERLYGHRERPR